MTLRNLTTGATVAAAVERRATWWGRARGLLGRSTLAPGEGVWLASCGAVHTLFMRVSIDVVFADAAGVVVAVHPAVAPGRAMLAAAGARTTIELGAGTLAAAAVAPGDRLALDDAYFGRTAIG